MEHLLELIRKIPRQITTHQINQITPTQFMNMEQRRKSMEQNLALKVHFVILF